MNSLPLAAERKAAAGRKPTCRVLIFKLLILQRLHNLSDKCLQYQVSDRLSFMRFLGLELSGNVPDARTVWAFRETFKEHQLTDALFECLNQALADLGAELKSGQIIDTTFVPVSNWSQTRDELHAGKKDRCRQALNRDRRSADFPSPVELLAGLPPKRLQILRELNVSGQGALRFGS